MTMSSTCGASATACSTASARPSTTAAPREAHAAQAPHAAAPRAGAARASRSLRVGARRGQPLIDAFCPLSGGWEAQALDITGAVIRFGFSAGPLLVPAKQERVRRTQTLVWHGTRTGGAAALPPN